MYLARVFKFIVAKTFMFQLREECYEYDMIKNIPYCSKLPKVTLNSMHFIAKIALKHQMLLFL